MTDPNNFCPRPGEGVPVCGNFPRRIRVARNSAHGTDSAAEVLFRACRS